MATPRRRRTDSSGPLAPLGTLVADRRRALGLTQLDAAELAGVGVSSIAALESGSDRMTLAVLLRILDALGLGLLAGAVVPDSVPHLVRVGTGIAP